MADISFSMSADEKDVTKALQNLIKENAKLRGEIQTGVTEAKAAAAQEREWQKLREQTAKQGVQQMQQLNAAAQKIKESIATPYDEAKTKVAELRKHLQAGTLTVDEYRKAYANVAKELKEATRDHAAEAAAATKAAKEKADAARDAAAAERAHSAAVREGTAVAEKYATKEERVSAEIKRLNALKEKGVLSSEDHARAVQAENASLSESDGIIGGLTDKMTGFVAGLASAGTVIAFLKTEYDALIERQGKSRDANISLAAEQEALLMNLGGADAGQVTGQISSLSKSSGVKEENITRAVNEAMAARGDMEVSDVIAAVGTAAKVRKFAPSELAGLAGATIDTQKQTGLGTEESLGFLMQMQAQSRTKSLKGLAENFTPAVGGVMNFGADRQTAGGILAALSHGMGDTTGAQTGTSAIQLAKQLRTFSGGKDIGESISNLQADPEARKEFLAKASFEAKALPAIESLLSGGTQAKQYAAAKTALQANPLDTLNATIANRNLPAMNLAQKGQEGGNVIDQSVLGDTGGAESAIIRDQIKNLRLQLGTGETTARIAGVIDDVMSGGVQTTESALKTLESKSALMSAGKTDATQRMSGPGGGVESDWFSRTVYGESTEAADTIKKNLADPEFMRQAKLMEEMVGLLKRQLKLQEEANANGEDKAHAGVVGNRRNNQGEGGP